jgi:glycosyltransferase involved in cell wall biosynthesis
MKINIITSVYNGESTVVRAMESVKQLGPALYKHWLIDDCSRDGSRQKIIDNMREIDQLLVNSVNIGACESRNRVLELVPDDELVMNLDQDDVINADIISSILSLGVFNEVVVGEVARIESNREPIFERRFFNKLIPLVPRGWLRFFSILFWPSRIGASIFPVKALKEVGGFGPTRHGGEDWVMFYRLLCSNVRFRRIKDVIVHRYVDGQNESVKNRRKRLENWYKIASCEVGTAIERFFLFFSYLYKKLRS